jgi:hypothetical protein
MSTLRAIAECARATYLFDQGGSPNWHGLASNQGAGLLYSVDNSDNFELKALDPVTGTNTTRKRPNLPRSLFSASPSPASASAAASASPHTENKLMRARLKTAW